MNLKDLLIRKKPAILEKWFCQLLETYPADTANLLKNNKNKFSNPVGQTISVEMESLFEMLLKGTDPEQAAPLLDKIIRIRAVQEFFPSKALSFLMSLKKVVRDELAEEIRQDGISDAVVDFESRIDQLTFVGFDIYMKCREKIYELKSNEAKARAYTLLKRANMLCET